MHPFAFFRSLSSGAQDLCVGALEVGLSMLVTYLIHLDRTRGRSPWRRPLIILFLVAVVAFAWLWAWDYIVRYNNQHF